MFADYDGCAADAEHQRRQRTHIKVIYVSLHSRHAQFASTSQDAIVDLQQLIVTLALDFNALHFN
jgi:hypothetical protein